MYKRQEEAGIDPSGVEVVATFPELYLSPSDNAVTPVLALSLIHISEPTRPY